MKKNPLISATVALVVSSAFATIATLATGASAQSTERAKPKDAVPVEDAPVASKELIPPKEKATLESKVTTVKKGADTVDEYRMNGKLFKMRITPAKGPSYFLVDPKGDGNFIRADGPEQKIATPTWVLLEW